ncbi:MAG: class I SAM-dependent methyltransferase, partial [Pseudolabrys sp.]
MKFFLPVQDPAEESYQNIGADLAERLLVMAQAKADAQKLINATFRQADMENLGYSDDSFDAVVCVFAI